MAIQIKAKKDGFRRCGIPHTAEATVYPDDRFTEEELEILKAEPMLVVSEVEGGSGGKAKPNAKDSIALVEAAESIEELDKLAEGEDRKTVQEAIEKQRAELNEPKE